MFNEIAQFHPQLSLPARSFKTDISRQVYQMKEAVLGSDPQKKTKKKPPGMVSRYLCYRELIIPSELSESTSDFNPEFGESTPLVNYPF